MVVSICVVAWWFLFLSLCLRERADVDAISLVEDRSRFGSSNACLERTLAHLSTAALAQAMRVKRKPNASTAKPRLMNQLDKCIEMVSKDWDLDDGFGVFGHSFSRSGKGGCVVVSCVVVSLSRWGYVWMGGGLSQ